MIFSTRRSPPRSFSMGLSYSLLLYNIRYGTGHGWKFHAPFPFSGFLRRTHQNIEKITAFIKSLNPDIVGLIEVDSGSYRAKSSCQVVAMAEELGYVPNYNSKYAGHSFAQRIPIMNKQGNAFLTRPAIKNKTIHFFDKGVKRLAIELELEEVTIFLVHLSIKYRSRQWQLNQLHNLIKKVDKPVIVAGDLNMFWGEQEIELFLGATGLINMNTANRPTYPSRKPKRQLDFILHSPEITVQELKVFDGATYSDHLPLMCRFSVN